MILYATKPNLSPNSKNHQHPEVFLDGICHPSQQRQLVNTAVRSVLPFDPDASDLPVARDLGRAKKLSAGGWEPKIEEKLYGENEGFLI